MTVVERIGPGAAGQSKRAVTVRTGRCCHIGKADRIVIGVRVADAQRAVGCERPVFGHRTGEGAANNRGVFCTVDGNGDIMCGAIGRGYRDDVVETLADIELLDSGLGVVGGVAPVASRIDGETPV